MYGPPNSVLTFVFVFFVQRNHQVLDPDLMAVDQAERLARTLFEFNETHAARIYEFTTDKATVEQIQDMNRKYMADFHRFRASAEEERLRRRVTYLS